MNSRIRSAGLGEDFQVVRAGQQEAASTVTAAIEQHAVEAQRAEIAAESLSVRAHALELGRPYLDARLGPVMPHAKVSRNTDGAKQRLTLFHLP
jgi:hypothetical protein